MGWAARSRPCCARSRCPAPTKRLYLAEGLPTLIVWGEDDRMIPISHGRAAAKTVLHSRFEPIPDAGHYPHEDDPDRFTRFVTGFMATTQPRTQRYL